jgi:peptidoglycan-N-acetylglucosamine deacetylase
MIDTAKAKAGNGLDHVKVMIPKNAGTPDSHYKQGALLQASHAQRTPSLRLPVEHSEAVPQWHFTIDVDWVPGSQLGLTGLLEFCERWRLKATIFVAGRFAEAYPDLIKDCVRQGHELGTHGWEHGSLEDDEDFRSATYDQQRGWIRRATDAVEQASGVRPVVFRAPSLWIGETTLRALEAEGYRYDSSVPARRFDCGFGRVHYLKYFRAPREPYRPSSTHLCVPGHSSIIEVAPSAFLFPLNLATLRTFGLPVLAWLVRRIVRQSSRVVFYCHPHEFVTSHQQRFPRNMSVWNMKGMRPENFTLLDGFAGYMRQLGYSSALFEDSYGL